MSFRTYTNLAASSTLSGGITNSQTTLVLHGTTNWPTSFPFQVSIEPDTATEELVLVTSGAGTSGTPYVITRGQDGTSGRTHADLAIAQHRISAVDFSDSRAHEAATTAHGLNSGMRVAGGAQPTLSTVNTTTSETALALFTVPGNQSAGQCYSLTAWGTFGTLGTGANTLLLRGRYNSGSVAAVMPTVTCLPLGNTGIWRCVLELQIISTGGSGAYQLSLSYNDTFDQTTAPTTLAILQRSTGLVTASGTNDTTVSHGLQISAAWGVSSVSNTITAVGGYGEQIC